jgi:hypothetical protein
MAPFFTRSGCKFQIIVFEMFFNNLSIFYRTAISSSETPAAGSIPDFLFAL